MGSAFAWVANVKPTPRQQIISAFGPNKRRTNAKGIEQFTRSALTYRLVDSPSASEVRWEIEHLRATALQLLAAMEDSSSEALGRLIIAGAALGRPDAVENLSTDCIGDVRQTVARLSSLKRDLIAENRSIRQRNRDLLTELSEAEMRKLERPPQFGRLEDDSQQKASNVMGKTEGERRLATLQNLVRGFLLDLTMARKMFKPSRGARADNHAALELVSHLFDEWQVIFGLSPSINKNSEFHRVANAVAQQHGLKIGSRILRKANVHREPITA